MIPNPCQASRGFTLIELAVVIAIVGLLLGSLLTPLSAHVEQRRSSEARQVLRDATEALLGFAVAHGRLPCPASASSNGHESPAGGGDCSNAHDGYLPAATLGIMPTDDQGYAIDPWGNRIRYAVTAANDSAFTRPTGLGTQYLSAPPSPDLQVCSTAAGVSGGRCAAGAALSSSAAAVIVSFGPNGLAGSGADEAQNRDNDRVFVSRVAGTSPSGGEFDDIVAWLSPHVLYSRMVAAGKLP